MASASLDNAHVDGQWPTPMNQFEETTFYNIMPTITLTNGNVAIKHMRF